MAQTCWVRFLGTLGNGLRVGDEDTIDSKLSKLSKWTKFWAWFWAFLILLFISFLLLMLGDKFSSEGLALTRFMARAQAPLTGQFVYPDSVARDQITVVLYDRQFLQDNGSAWPITYQEHADALLRLAADPAARPKAIFLDITFGQQRNDPTITLLKQALCTLQNDYKVPVFLAALPSDNGELAVRDGLMGKSSDGPACFVLVGVDYIPDALDDAAWTYQLTRHRTKTGWEAGPSPDMRQPAYRSAAMAVAQNAAGTRWAKKRVRRQLFGGTTLHRKGNDR